ncbi:MAG: 1-(5-phosphoribosyl)-5-amino-4-imidazole-carboxylate carboxylase, partial [Myxococcota bacterium]
MDRGRIEELLRQMQRGERTLEQTAATLSASPGARIPDAHVDLQRRLRTGHPEVIYGQGKRIEQIIAILTRLHEAGQDGLVTRLSEERAARVRETLPDAIYHPLARILTRTAGDRTTLPDDAPRIAVVCAGTSDLPVAEEAAVTAAALGHPVDRYTDIGVAGLHRLLGQL